MNKARVGVKSGSKNRSSRDEEMGVWEDCEHCHGMGYTIEFEPNDKEKKNPIEADCRACHGEGGENKW